MARYSSQDREFEKEFKKSLQVSSYADQIIDKIHNNIEIEGNMVPDFGGGTAHAASNESSTLFHLDDTMMLKTAASALGAEGISAVLGSATVQEAAPQPKSQSNVPQKPQFKISQNQYSALTKYPALIEFLGTAGGASLVKEIAGKVNSFMVKKIEANSKEISKHAQVCVADRQNIKQYFTGENNEWVCAVTASGPFRGDEAILYHRDKDQSFVLRKVNDDYTDVTSGFNVIHEFGKVNSNE